MNLARPEAQRHPDRQSRRFRRNRSAQGADDRKSARGSFARRLPPVSRRADQAHARRAEGSGPRRQEHGPLQEFLRARACATGSTTARWTPRCAGSRTNSRSKPALVQPIDWPCKAGYSYCEATEAFQISYEIPPAKLAPGVYRNISGNTALAMGFVAASQKAGLPLFLGSYPITPASDILHELSALQRFRRDHVSGRRRNRRHHFGDRRGLRRRTGTHHHFRPWHGAEDRSARPRRRGRTAARDLRHPARRAFHRSCRQKPSRPICCKRSSARNSEAPIPVLAPPRPATASGSRSKRAASPSSTWCR